MQRSIGLYLLCAVCAMQLLLVPTAVFAQWRDPHALPNKDVRTSAVQEHKALGAEKAASAERLQSRVKTAKVTADRFTGSPIWVASPQEFLTGPKGKGRSVSEDVSSRFADSDPDRGIKGFLIEYADLYGHGPELLNASVKVSDKTSEYGVRTAVWRQKLQDVVVLNTVLAVDETSKGELMCIRGNLMPNLQAAANKGTPNWRNHLRRPPVNAAEAVASAARDLGSQLVAEDLSLVDQSSADASGVSYFASPGLVGTASTYLVWFRMDQSSLRLCWNVHLETRAAHGPFQMTVDAVTGEVITRNSLTFYQTPYNQGEGEATYAVYDDSPMPLSPGLPTPSAYLPPVVNRSMKTLRCLNPDASPLGWIPDHADPNAEPWNNMLVSGYNIVAYSYPMNYWLEGNPYRVFNPPIELSPTGTLANLDNNWQPGVVHSFYWGNVLHDRLWDLGFSGTITYGYVPSDIPWDWYGGFHRPDPVYIMTRDHALHYDSEKQEYYYPTSPHIHYETFNGTSPAIHMVQIPNPGGGYRDLAFCTDALIHEYQHLVTCRLMAAAHGGDSDIWEPDFSGYPKPIHLSFGLALCGAFEGISDFVALTFLGHPYLDNPNGEYGGCYPMGAYAAASYDIWDYCDYAPYYFGIRRLPYSTDRSKNPLTIEDIEVFDLGSTPYNAYFNEASDNWPWHLTDSHNAGEIFGSILWDLRAKMIQKIGEDANDTVIKLLNLGTRHFYFLCDDWADLRDAILLADTTYYDGQFRQEIWEAFAGRGLGENASCIYKSLLEGTSREFDILEDYAVAPDPGLSSQVAAPVFQPLGGWYESAPSVQITCDTPGATIRYTTDGSDPDTNSPVYNSTPIPVNATTVLKAKAWYGAEPPSRIRENLYTIYTAIPWERHDNEQVSFRGKVTAIFPQGSEKWIYIQHPDRIWGIRVVADSSIVAFPGWVMDVEGETRTNLENGERYVLADSGYPVRYGTEYGPVASLGMRNQWLGGDGGAFTPSINEAFGYYNVGLLVHTWGKVTYRNVNEGVFGIDDGTMLIEPLGVGCGSGRGVRVKLPAGMEMPALGTYLRVRGISSVAKAYPNGQGSYYVRQLLPRSYLDITEETSWHTMNIALDPDEWLYFSLPGIPKQPEPYHVMNRYPANTILWRSNNLYRWDARLDYWQSYVDGCGSELFGNFLVGDGYKFFHSNPYYPGYEYADGFTFEHADVTGDQFISLPNGSQSLPTTDSHSLIGNPFPTAKSWATMTVTDGKSIKSLPQAVTDGWIHSVKVWNGTTLQDVDVSTGSMEILKAYEIYPKYDNMALIIPE